MTAAHRALEFPPLLTGLAVAGDPFQAACDAVVSDVEPGAVFYAGDPATLRAAIVLAPEMALGDALGVSFAVSLGLSDALGALAPPEVGVHLVWPDRIKVNGALCGRLRFAASTADPDQEPDWLVIGVEVPVAAVRADEPGLTPDETCLFEEGCSDITVPDLLEAWARHMMNWLHIFLTDGFQPLHEEWRAKGDGTGGQIDYPEPGCFIGLDEKGGLILSDGNATRILPLTRLLKP